MTRSEKAQVIDELKIKFNENNHFYVADASGMTVAQINKFRSQCFKSGLEYRVVKNTLIQKALLDMDTDYSPFDEKVLRGFSGIIFSKDVANLPGKVIKDFRKKGTKPLLKGASIDKSSLYMGDEKLEELSNLKSKNELIGEIVTLLQSPMSNVMSALQSGKTTIAGLVKTLSEREK
jgi:large subunit ribosomal protein L10